MLEIYNKKVEDVVALIGDNVAVNKSFARNLGIPFIGCASHRFNLAVKDILEDNQLIISKVQSIMRKLSYQIPAANLRQFTHLRAVLNNETRWSSTYQMLKRYSVKYLNCLI